MKSVGMEASHIVQDLDMLHLLIFQWDDPLEVPQTKSDLFFISTSLDVDHIFKRCFWNKRVRLVRYVFFLTMGDQK
jgi:hypothetical protein